MGKFREYLESVTDKSTVQQKLEILADNGETPLENAIKMSKAGQAWLVLDSLRIALDKGDIEEEQAALLLASAMERELRWKKTKRKPKK